MLGTEFCDFFNCCLSIGRLANVGSCSQFAGYTSIDHYNVCVILNTIIQCQVNQFRFLSESPRWLIQHNRSVEAIAALKSMTNWNRTLINLDQLKDIVQMEVDKMNVNATKQRRQRYYFYHLFYSSTLCKYTVITAFIL
jgi:hypothetical protein